MPSETPDSSAVGGRYARYVLGVLIVVYIFNFIDRQILSILAEEIKADLGLTDADIGFLYGTAFAVFYAVFGIPLGRLADLWVRRSLIGAGLAFWSLMTALSGTARSFTGLALYRFGVGIGEASATPAAFSMLSDLFPPTQRATVLSIYSGGIYIGAGIGLFLGGLIVDGWSGAFAPGTEPLGLKGWQVAFFAVGLPGLLTALWVRTLKEPVRGLSEGLVVDTHPAPFREAWESLCSVLPPLTLYSQWRHGGGRAVAANLVLAATVALGATGLHLLVPSAIQWTALGIGVYAAGSWIQGQRRIDPMSYRLMFGSRSFVLVTLGFPVISFMTYGIGFWMPPYIVRHFAVPLSEAGTVLGLSAAVGGYLGITLGGLWADRWRRSNVNARLYIGVLVPVLTVPLIVGLLTTDSVVMAYGYNLLLSVTSTLWIGSAASTVTDLVLPQQRGTASAYYVLMNTFLGLALGPFAIGQLSDRFARTGMAADAALSSAMLVSLSVLVVAIVALLLATRTLGADEASKTERAAAAS